MCVIAVRGARERLEFGKVFVVVVRGVIPLIGACIVAYEQDGEDRASYGTRLLERLAEDFAGQGIQGLSARNLRNCRKVAQTWPRLLSSPVEGGLSEALELLGASIWQTSAKSEPEGTWQTSARSLPSSLPAPPEALSWQDEAWNARLLATLSFSHLLELSRVADPMERAFYEVHTMGEGWSVRELRRQRDSLLYQRAGLSSQPEALLALARQEGEASGALVRDPYVLEFLGLEERTTWSESELETALLEHLEAFLLELGRDFAFMGRQVRTVGGRHHHLDLLFFHRRLRCLVVVELKIGRFQHEDAGQMNFYLNYLRENQVYEGESPPVGIILCADKDVEVVHYATAGLERQVFVSRYLVALPSEERLKAWLREEQELLTRMGPPPGT